MSEVGDEFGAAGLSYPSRTMSVATPEQGGPHTRRMVMHPVITEAVAAQRARELHADAAAARRAHQFRRVPAVLPAVRRLRGPRAA